MKKIVATIKPVMIDDVIFALHQVRNFPGATISEVKGIGKGFHHVNEINEATTVTYLTFVRMEIICHAYLAERIIDVIMKNAHTGNNDDGKITVLSLDDAFEVSSKMQL